MVTKLYEAVESLAQTSGGIGTARKLFRILSEDRNWLLAHADLVGDDFARLAEDDAYQACHPEE
jgi:hypothetical protein